MEISLNTNAYDTTALIMMKIPLTMPYLVDWPDFEPSNREIEKDGRLYRSVKEKVQQDSLVLLVLPEEDKMRLRAADNEFFKSVNDLANTGAPKKNTGGPIKFHPLEYDHFLRDRLLLWTGLVQIGYPSNYLFLLPPGYHSVPDQPPACVVV